MPLAGPVLVATDLTDASDEAVRQGIAFASRLRAPLVVCHVVPELDRVRMLFPQDAGADAAAYATLEQRAEQGIRDQVARVVKRPPGEFDICIEAGSPHAGILTRADAGRAGVVVIGPGRVADRVVRHAHCPVLVARASPPGCVMAATDFSDPATPAIEGAVGEARRRQVPLRVVHALDLAPPALMSMPGDSALAALSPSVIASLTESARERMDRILDGLGATGEVVVAPGPAAAAILDAAQEAATELIVVGTRGRTGLPRLALGSVAETVLHRAACSVLVVRLPGDHHEADVRA